MAENDDTVEYRPIQDWPGYRVGDDGSVWTCLKQVNNGGWATGFHTEITEEWRRLKPSLDKSGYLRVALRHHKAYVHDLVLEAFVGPRPDGMEARHFPDRTPANCRKNNLQWSTHAENIGDKNFHGTSLRGEKHHQAVATEDVVMAIRHEYAETTDPLDVIAARHGIKRTTAQAMVNGETWTHLPIIPYPKNRRRRA